MIYLASLPRSVITSAPPSAVAGRNVTWADIQAGAKVAVTGEDLARGLGGPSILGRSLELDGGPPGNAAGNTCGGSPGTIQFLANYFTTIDVACMLLFSLLAFLFSVPFLVGLALQGFRTGDYPLANLWPTFSRNRLYLSILVANVCIATAFALHFPTMGASQLLVAVVAIVAGTAAFRFIPRKWTTGKRSFVAPALVLAVILAVAGTSWRLLPAAAYAVLCIPFVSARLQCFAGPSRRMKPLYLGAVLSLLAVLVVAPCFALFKLSYNTVNRLALESAQLERLDFWSTARTALNNISLARRRGSTFRHSAFPRHWTVTTAQSTGRRMQKDRT